VLVDITAVAVNWAESPGFAVEVGAVTVTDVTIGAGAVGVVGGDVVPLPPQLSTAMDDGKTQSDRETFVSSRSPRVCCRVCLPMTRPEPVKRLSHSRQSILDHMVRGAVNR